MTTIARSLLVGVLAQVLPNPWPCWAAGEVAPLAALAVEPAKVKVARFREDDGSAEAIVIARTAGPIELPRDLKPSFTASPGLEITIGDRMAESGDLAWPVSVRATGGAPDAAAVDFRLAYPVSSGAPRRDASAASPVNVLRARLEVAVEPVRDAWPVADAELSIKANFASIREGVLATAYLLVKNKSAYSFRVEPPKVDSPKFLTATPRLAEAARVGPNETFRVPIDIEIAKGQKSQIGEWLILANVTLTRGEGGFQRKGSAVVEQKVTVGVPGVSDVLKVLDLPSLLLVPGALILATWSMMLGAGASANLKWLEWKSSSFWVVAITLSIIVFGVLSIVRSRYNLGADFLVAFNVADVAWLWLSCVGGGAATFLVYRGAKTSWNGYRKWREDMERRAREPQPDDKPIDILKKLHRMNLRFYLPSYEPELGGQPQQIFKLGFSAPEQMAWVAPRMLLKQVAQHDSAKRLTERIRQANDRPRDGLPVLIAALDEGLKANSISLEWELGEISGPQLMRSDRLGAEQPQASPLEGGGG